MSLDVRLFTGLSLPPEVNGTLDSLIEELRPLARIRWSHISQLHITTKFIGSWPFHRMSEIGRFLANLPRQRKFTVRIAGLEYFKNPDNSRLLFAKVEPSEGLIQLAADTDHYLGQLKVPLESREYAPHVTIGRIPGQNPWPKLDERIGEHADTHFGTFEAAEYSLYQSTPAGYRVIETIPLD